MKKSFFVLVVICLIGVIVLGGCAQSAPVPAPKAAPAAAPAPAPAPAPSAAQPIVLKYSTFGPPVHFNSALGKQFCDEITQKSNGKMKIDFYGGGSLLGAGKTYEGIVQGVADIGGDMPAFSPGRFPLSEGICLSWGYSTSMQSSQTVWDVLQKLQPKELEDTHMLWLASDGSPCIMSQKPIRSMEDLKGLKIRCSGDAVKFLTRLGAVPVAKPISEVYEALQKGTVEAALSGYDTLQTFKLSEVSKYICDGASIGYTSINWNVMNLNKWNSLPKDMQQLMTDTANKYLMLNAQAWDKGRIDGLEYFKKTGTVVELNPGEADKWAKTIAPALDEWMAANEGKLPVKEMAAIIKQDMAKFK